MRRTLFSGLLFLTLMSMGAGPALAQQFRPGISVVNFTMADTSGNDTPATPPNQQQPAQAPAANADNATIPTPTSDPRTFADQTKERAKKLQINLTPTDLQRLMVDFKGALLNSKHYRIIPAARKLPGQTQTIDDIIADIDNNQYSDANYVVAAKVIYQDTQLLTNVVASPRRITYTLSFTVVAEFSLINVITGKVESTFIAMGTGEDKDQTNNTSSSVNVNKMKILKNASLSLADSAVSAMANQINIKQAEYAGLMDASGDPRIRIVTLKAPEPEKKPTTSKKSAAPKNTAKKAAAKPKTSAAPAIPSASPAAAQTNPLSI